MVLDTISRLALPRLTLDGDGAAVRRGETVARTLRGVTPLHRKDPRHSLVMAHLAQAWPILRPKRRPSTVRDSKQAVAPMRETIDGLRGRPGRRVPVEFRMDGALSRQTSSGSPRHGAVPARSRSAAGRGRPSSAWRQRAARHGRRSPTR